MKNGFHAPLRGLRKMVYKLFSLTAKELSIQMTEWLVSHKTMDVEFAEECKKYTTFPEVIQILERCT